MDQEAGEASFQAGIQPPRAGRNTGGGGLAAREQEGLWNEILRLADYVLAAFHKGVEALCEGRTELADAVRAEEREVDQWEVRVEQSCLRILALYDPVASDLRKVLAALRINGELEGLADLAENLARRARKLHGDPAAAPYFPALRELATRSRHLVGEALLALRSLDADAARRLIEADNEVDQLRGGLLDELKIAIRDTPDRVNTWLRLINSARNLERAADHATYIAQAVVYVREGTMLKRGRLDPADD